MIIENSQLEDLPVIFDLYEKATDFMKSKNQVHWPEFSRSMITKEIQENRQWKLVLRGKIACIWAIAFNDEVIWGDKDKEPSLYLHRIATNPDFRGQKLVNKLVIWASDFGKIHQLKYIRLDTVGLNKGLIDHYEKMGFQFLGTKKLTNTDGLPEHYEKGEVCYFQKSII